jgi:hypothetical protein
MFSTIHSQTVVKLSALCTACILPHRDPLVLISLTGLGNPRAIVQLEGLGKLKKFNDFIGT